MAVTQYIGSRYVPIFAEPIEWSSAKEYEPLTIVVHEGNSFTSKQFVPVGIDISNGEFWALTGNYNGQVEQYRRETAAAHEAADNALTHANAAQSDIDKLLPKNAFSEENTVQDYINNKFLRPERFGAVGNGVVDDTQAFIDLFNAVSDNDTDFTIIVCQPNKTYSINNVVINASNFMFYGSGSTIRHSAHNGFVISSSCHDISFENVNFEGSYNITNPEYSNTSVGIIGESNTARYQAYNISFFDCNFTCGVFGISANNVLNLIVQNCKFNGSYYVLSDGAGGYGVLLQSCVNVLIQNCLFVQGDYSRHDIYVSVRQPKTSNKNNENVRILNCVFDHSQKNPQAGGAYYSPTTVSMIVRHSDNVEISNCTVKKGTGLVTVTDEDGATRNIIVRNCTVDAHFISGSVAQSEARQAVAKIGTLDESSIVVDGLIVTADNANYQDANFAGGVCEYCNTKTFYRVTVNKVKYLFFHDIYDVAANPLMYEYVDSPLQGKIYNIHATRSVVIGASSAGAKISLAAYGRDLLGPFSVSGAGVLSAPLKAHIPASAEVVSNHVLITLGMCPDRPTFVDVMPIGTARIIMAEITSSTLAANQFYLAPFDLSGAASTSYACRFFIDTSR